MPPRGAGRRSAASTGRGTAGQGEPGEAAQDPPTPARDIPEPAARRALGGEATRAPCRDQGQAGPSTGLGRTEVPAAAKARLRWRRQPRLQSPKQALIQAITQAMKGHEKAKEG